MMLRAALALAKRNLPVFPCRERGKEPAIYNGVKGATTAACTIRGWWGAEPNLNIGLATGEPAKVFVIDIDSDDGEASLSALEVDNGALPATVEVITGRGRHLYFNMPGAPIANSAGRIAAGIDVRGTGGYVLAPPSIHPSGRAYAWSVDSTDAFADAPQWLIDKATGGAAGSGKPRPDTDWQTVARSTLGEGNRNDTISRMAGYLLCRYVDAGFALELLQSWNVAHCNPPLPASEVLKIVDSIAGRELKKRGLA
jgi:hypothetical protein